MGDRDAGAEDPRRVLLAEHDRLTELVMLVEIIEGEQQPARDKVDARVLRPGTGQALIDSLTRRNEVLRELGLQAQPRRPLWLADGRGWSA